MCLSNAPISKKPEQLLYMHAMTSASEFNVNLIFKLLFVCHSDNNKQLYVAWVGNRLTIIRADQRRSTSSDISV